MVSDYRRSLLESYCVACLNPCCNGIWSQTYIEVYSQEYYEVLILVVMEYGLRLPKVLLLDMTRLCMS